MVHATSPASVTASPPLVHPDPPPTDAGNPAEPQPGPQAGATRPRSDSGSAHAARLRRRLSTASASQLAASGNETVRPASSGGEPASGGSEPASQVASATEADARSLSERTAQSDPTPPASEVDTDEAPLLIPTAGGDEPPPTYEANHDQKATYGAPDAKGKGAAVSHQPVSSSSGDQVYAAVQEAIDRLNDRMDNAFTAMRDVDHNTDKALQQARNDFAARYPTPQSLLPNQHPYVPVQQQYVPTVPMQPQVQGMPMQPQVQGVTTQPQVQGVTTQPQVQGVTTQPQVQGVPMQPHIQYVPMQPHVQYMPMQPYRSAWIPSAGRVQNGVLAAGATCGAMLVASLAFPPLALFALPAACMVGLAVAYWPKRKPKQPASPAQPQPSVAQS